MEKLFSTTEFAKICQISRFTASKWVKEGKIKGTSLGRNYKIPIEEVLRFFKEYNFPIPEELKAGDKDRDRPEICCWEYYSREKSSSPHQCDACLIKQASIRNCYIMRIDDYQEKIKCMVECSKCNYFLEKFANYFAIVTAFDEPAVVCGDGTILAANRSFLRICEVTTDADVIGQDFLDFLADSSKADFFAYRAKVKENNPLRPGEVNVTFIDAKWNRTDVRLSCKRLKNIPNTFLIFFKV